jgi:hypothetical protein
MNVCASLKEKRGHINMTFAASKVEWSPASLRERNEIEISNNTDLILSIYQSLVIQEERNHIQMTFETGSVERSSAILI